LTRPTSVLSQKLSSALRTPPAVGLNRTNTVQLSPFASADERTHVPPDTTAKSDAFKLDEAIPILQKLKLPLPVFVTVAVAGVLDSPSENAPKSIAAGESVDSPPGNAVPLSPALTRPASVLSQKLSKPLRAPGAVGLKRTNTVQLSPLASVSDREQVPPATTKKSLGFALEEAMPNRQKDKVPAPVFVTVTVAGSLDDPTCTGPKSTFTGDTDDSEAGIAVPLRATLMRPASVLSQKLSRPLRAPVAVGLNRTSTVQLSPPASAAAVVHVPPARTLKSLGFALEDAIPKRQKDKAPAPALVSVTVARSLDVPSCTDPKSTLAGDADETGGGVALPPRATLVRPTVVLSQKLSRPLRAPVAVGLKRTSTVQLSALPRAAAVVHVPPGTTLKSLGFALEDAIPKRQNDRLPSPLFKSVTVTGSLDIPICTDPKSTLVGVGDEIGGVASARATGIANEGCAPAAQAHAEATTARSAATSLRALWGLAANVTLGGSSPH
jgi:hypothetical protein